MRIRFLNTYDTNITTFFRDLLPFIASAGHQAQVIISRAEYLVGRNLENAIGHIPGVQIFRTTTFGLQPTRGITKAFVTVAYLLHTMLYTLFGPRADLNIFMTQPPLFPLWGYVLSRLRQQPYYCVIMDVYPQLMVEIGMMRRDAFLTKLLTWLSAFALRKSQGVIVIGRCMANRIQAMGIHADKIHLIPNWSDDQLVHPIDSVDNPFRQNLGLSDKFVVLYSGNMSYLHHFDDILSVAEQLQDQKNIVFLFIGGGSRYKEIQTYLTQHQLNNVLLLPFQPIEVLTQSLNTGDLHLVTLKEAGSGLSVPSKAYNILAAGRPILYQGSKEDEIARMVLEEEIGAVVACGDVEGLKQSILRYANQPALCQRQGRKAFALSQGPYSRPQALQRYGHVLGISQETHV